MENLHSQKQSLLEQYLINLDQIDQLNINNQYLQNMIDSQIQQLSSLQTQLTQVDQTNESLIPMMQSMLNSLEAFVALDMPFLLEKRQQRIADLKTLFKQADVSLASKYRKIL